MSKSKSKENFIELASSLHDDFYSYECCNYINRSVKVLITCPIHGNFLQTPKNHLRRRGCPRCKGSKIRSAKQMGFEKFKEKALNKHDYIYQYKEFEYKNNNSRAIIVCKKHGEFRQRVSDHLSGKGCFKCSKDKLRKSLGEFINQAFVIHNGYYDYSQFNYTNNSTKSIIICPVHGEFKQSANAHLSGHGCKKCTNKISNNETKWLDGLESKLDILIRRQCKIPNTKYIVDGFCKETNTIYEFNGDYWHGNPTKYAAKDINANNKKTFGELYQFTVDKENALKALGYEVISIWESEYY